MANSYNTVVVQSSGSTLILAANTWREGITLYNNSGVTVYIGTDTSVATSTGLPMLAGATFDLNGWQQYKGAVYGIAASATADMRYLEWTR